MKNQTQVQVLSREAGRELDAEIAEKVFGWTVNRRDRGGWRLLDATGSPVYVRGHAWYCGDLPPFSSEIGAAWLVVGELHRRNYDLDLAGAQRPHAPGVEWEATFSHPELHLGCAFADAGPLAICRASLAALATLTPEAPDAR